jgi:hypothetical protein
MPIVVSVISSEIKKVNPEGLGRKTSKFGPDAIGRLVRWDAAEIEMNLNTEKCLDRNSFCSIHP